MSFEKQSINLEKEEAEQLSKRMDDQEANKKIDGTINFDQLVDKMKTMLFKKKELIRSLARLVLELKERITDYDTILSDDSSGRLVSLLLRKIINKQRKKSGKEGIKTNFLNTGRALESIETFEAVKKFLLSKKDLGKILIVTEYIETGGSMSRFLKLLEEINIKNYDVATVSIRPGGFSKPLIKKLGKRFKYGEHSFAGMAFHKRHEHLGVKMQEGNAHPRTYKSFLESLQHVWHKVDVNMLKWARQDVNTLANELVKLVE